jgi:hypothetical protein
MPEQPDRFPAAGEAKGNKRSATTKEIMLMGYVLVATFVSVFAIAMIGIAARIRFVYRMKTYHREQWLKIGSPSLLGNQGIFEASMIRYLRLREYVSLDDPKTVRSARDLRAVAVALLVCISVASATIFGIILFGKYIAHE